MPLPAETFIPQTELDIDSYKESLKTYLKEQAVFSDYNFEGSTINALIGLLAYNTYLGALYNNQIGSEMFLDTAQLRDSIVSHAKELNYTPRSRSSARIYLDVTATATDNPDVVVLPKYYEIVGTDRDGNKVYLNTPESILLQPSPNNANLFTAANVAFYEGTVVKEVFVANTENRYILSSANVDTSSIEVVVQNSNTDTANTIWLVAETLFDLNSTDKVFFVQATADNKYELVFGNGIVGQQLNNGNLVRVTYRDTLGAEANGIKDFSADLVITNGSYPVSVINVDGNLSFGGAERENDEDIRFNAPKYFATQERAVTASDFITLIRNKFPSIEVVTAYGGEEATPPVYGKVVISAKPYNGTFVPEPLKNEILGYIKTKSTLGIDPIFVEPDYFFVAVESTVTYDISGTTLTYNQLASDISTAILNFNGSYLSDFGADLRYTKLTRVIDDTNPSIVSNDTKVKMVKRIVPQLGVPTTYSILFGNELYGESVRFQHPEGHDPIVYTGPFQYTVLGTSYTSYIQDDGNGVLVVYTLQQGERVILNTNIGSVNYDTGEVIINSLVVTEYDGANIKVYARLENADIETSGNKILLIEQEDIDITMKGIRL